MRVGVVVPTLGNGDLQPLLSSLAEQHLAPVAVVVVDQSPDGTNMPPAPFPVRRVRRPPGLSAARNAGVGALLTWDAVAFADDDSRFEPPALAAAVARLQAGADIVCGKVLTGANARVAYLAAASRLDRSTVWRSAMEGGLVFSRNAWDRLGGFDETLGLGAATPWQSGEGTDLLLRAFDEGMSVWFDPAVVIREQPPTDVTEATRRFKARIYARGTGRVYAQRYGWAGRVRLIARTVGRLARDLPAGRPALALDIQILAGRLEGLTGRARPARTADTTAPPRGNPKHE